MQVEQGFMKKDLVAGKHIVKTRDGCVGLVVYNGKRLLVMFDNNTNMGLTDQEEDLTYDQEDCCIDEVYELEDLYFKNLFNLDYHKCVFQRPIKQKKQLTLEQLREIVGEDFDIVDENDL